MKHLSERGGHRYNLIVKYRQGGITTLYEIDELDEALWVPGMSCGIIAHEAKKLPEYFNIVKLAYQYLPDIIKPKTKTDTKNMYEFTTRYDGYPLNSSIYVATDVRGGTVQRLHITESAYIKDRNKLKAASKQAVPLTGCISEETTGNGFNEFWDDYEAARTNPNPGPMDYRAYFYSWVEHPEYTLPGTIEEYEPRELEIIKIAKEQYGITLTDGQLLWRRWKRRELFVKQEGIGLSGDQLFMQEYPLTPAEAFQSGAGNIFDAVKIDNTTPRAFVTNYDDKARVLAALGVRFWHLPIPGIKYYIGVDPSDGEGSDNTAIDVWDQDRKQCAQFYGLIRPDRGAELAAELGHYYNNAFAGVENNMLSFILFMSKIYDNYFFTTTIDEKTKKKTKKIGWNTNTKTRDPMIDNYIIAFDDDALQINSTITLKEMKTFVKKDNGKREHADGKHDDALIAAMIANNIMTLEPARARAFTNNPLR